MRIRIMMQLRHNLQLAQESASTSVLSTVSSLHAHV